MLIIFDCTKDQIAHNLKDITPNTKVYVGQLEPGIFQKLPENLEHIYTYLSDSEMRREKVEIGGKSAEQLMGEMKQAGIKINNSAGYMMKSEKFTPGKNVETVTLIRLTVADLGFNRNATIDQIYERAQVLGLELCPPDAGPNYRLKYMNQPLNEILMIGMNQITVRDDRQRIFVLERDIGGLGIDFDFAEHEYEWAPHAKFLFCLPTSSAGRRKVEA